MASSLPGCFNEAKAASSDLISLDNFEGMRTTAWRSLVSLWMVALPSIVTATIATWRTSGAQDSKLHYEAAFGMSAVRTALNCLTLQYAISLPSLRQAFWDNEAAKVGAMPGRVRDPMGRDHNQH